MVVSSRVHSKSHNATSSSPRVRTAMAVVSAPDELYEDDDEEVVRSSSPRTRRGGAAGRSTRRRKLSKLGGTGVMAAGAAIVLLWVLALLGMHRNLPSMARLSCSDLTGLHTRFGPLRTSPSRIVFVIPPSLSDGSLRPPKTRVNAVILPTSALSMPTTAKQHGDANGTEQFFGVPSSWDNGTQRMPSNPRSKQDATIYYEEDQIVSHRRGDGKSSPVACRPPSFAFLNFPTCNAIHEINLQASGNHERDEEDSYVIANGYYRDVWVVIGTGSAGAAATATGTSSTKSVLKTTRFHFDVDQTSLMNAKHDAVIMERLTSRPNIVSLWGHCGTSTWVEALPYEVQPYVVPRNNNHNLFTAAEKLRMALEMAESLAELHGYRGGSISHGDVQLSQWLRSRNDQLVLGDFHSSHILCWDEPRRSYGPYSTGTVFGNYRSPEEYASSLLNEQVDVYSFGNNLYGLLTGRWVFHSTQDDEVVRVKVRQGERPELLETPRSFEERRLAELMAKCWVDDPIERITIFDAVSFLRKAVAESESDRVNSSKVL